MRSTIQRTFYVNLLATAAFAGTITTTFTPTPVKAQALQPAVDVCTGITLPRSAITEIIGAVNQPIVDQVETTVNGITTVTLILAPLATITDLNIDLTTILADAAAGDPISLQILDTDGNVITASDSCNVTADGFTLNTEGGISIGGNQITGLGTNGQPAIAGEEDAIAFGNNASTAVGATGAVAIGTDATATAVNSVALGAGSVADRGPQTGYAAPGITGTSDSVGSVSVGAAGAERQITNVAPGTAASDAATVGQVTGLVTAATADSVQYDDATHTTVTLDGAGGTTVTNVADGTLDALSSDAVNGSQLFATNGQVAANTAATAANTADIAALEANAVQYDDPTQTSITLGGAGGTTISNLADGEVSATSSEAINGSQLFATNQQVAANTADIGDLQTDVADLQTDVADLQTGLGALGDAAVQYDDPSHASVTLDGAAGTTIGNVAAGDVDATSTDAVNGSQLFATNQAVAGNTADIANLDGRVTVNEGDIANLDGRVTVNEGDIANLDGRVTVNEGDIANLDGRVTVNEGDIANLDNRVTVNQENITTLQTQVANVPVRFVSNADGTTPSATPTNTAALVSANGGTTRLTNVAPATLSATSTDAVNGSQLFATNQQVAANTSSIQTINNNLAGSTVVAVQYSNPSAPTVSNGGTITNDVTFIGANPGAPVAVHNVATGTLANDAANVGQVQAGLASTLASAQAYTDDRIADLGFDLANLGSDVRSLRRDAFSGTAAAMAVAGIPQTIEAGGRMIGGGMGYYRGQAAFAIGASATFNDGRGVAKAGATLDSRGKGGFSAGAGFSF